MRRYTLRMDCEDLNYVAQSAMRAIDDPHSLDQVREDMRLVFDLVTDVLVYCEPEIVMQPATFDVENYHARVVDAAVAALDPVVAEAKPGYIAIARRLAGEIDNRSYATRFRRTLLTELDHTLGLLDSESEAVQV
jgi:hypothetical protein